jgi:hypothetical protein
VGGSCSEVRLSDEVFSVRVRECARVCSMCLRFYPLLRSDVFVYCDLRVRVFVCVRGVYLCGNDDVKGRNAAGG